MVEVNDYTLSDKDRQSIYRKLVLSNDLKEANEVFKQLPEAKGGYE